jgi:hypothetical protein
MGAVRCGFCVCGKQVGETPGVSAKAGAMATGIVTTTAASALARAMVASESNGTIRMFFNEPHLHEGILRP